MLRLAQKFVTQFFLYRILFISEDDIVIYIKFRILSIQDKIPSKCKSPNTIS